MPKKTTVLIAILAVVTVVLLGLALIQSQKQNTLMTSISPTPKPVEKTAKIFFNPGTWDSTSATTPTASVDIIIDSGNSALAGAQVELQYDPKALSNVKVAPDVSTNSFFGGTANVLFNENTQSSGKVEFAIGIPPTGTAKKGSGKIATLSFQKLPGTTEASTTIVFLNKTLVLMLDSSQSVLKDTTPLMITLGQAQPNKYLPPTTQAPSKSTAPSY